MANRLKMFFESMNIISRGGSKVDSKVQYDDEIPFIGSELDTQEVAQLIRKVKEINSSRASRKEDYKYMMQDGIISGAVELVADEASVIDDLNSLSYWVDCPKSPKLEKALNDWLLNDIKINSLSWKMAYQLLIDGGYFLRTHLNTEESMDVIEPGNYFELMKDYIRISDLTLYGKTIAYQWEDEEDPNNVTIFKANEFIHSYWDKGEYDNVTLEYQGKPVNGLSLRKTTTCKEVYGTSYLENSRQAFLILDLIDTMLLSARVNNTALTRLIMTEVGTSGKTETKKIIERVKSAFKVSSLQVNQSYKEGNKTASIQNVFIPTRNQKGDVRVEEVGGNVDIRDIADIEYYTDKLLASLRIPKAFLGLDSNITSGLGINTMTKVDIRYARLIKTVKNIIRESIIEMIEVKLSLDPELNRLAEKYNWSVESTKVSTSEEDEKAQTLQTNMTVAEQIKGLVSDSSLVNQEALIKYLLDYIVNLPDIESFFDVTRVESAVKDAVEKINNDPQNIDSILNKIGTTLQDATSDTANTEEE